MYEESLKLLGRRNVKDDRMLIDYYLILPSKETIYAFTKNYSNRTYNRCRSGIRVNELTKMRSTDTNLMKLVKYTNYIMPYLADYYDLPIKTCSPKRMHSMPNY